MELRAMIIQPMAGKTRAEVFETRERAIKRLEDMGYNVENSLFDMREAWLVAGGTTSVPLRYLAESLKVMSRCHAVYLCDGWADARGCRIEYEAASEYGLLAFFESSDQPPIASI